jgi:glycosyltransferase involved in cell wall biosynthesis
MARRLAELVSGGRFDVVHVEHLRAARMLRAAGPAPVVYDSVDCISLLFEQAARQGQQLRSRLMTALDVARTRRYEGRLLGWCDQAIVTSERDKVALEKLAVDHPPMGTRPAPITVVTNGVDLDYFRPPPGGAQRDRRTVVFTGKMSYHANVTGALYFAREVLPRIWATDPEVRFRIVGKGPPKVVQRLATDGRIEVTGYVDDLRPHMAEATLAVCPVLYAAGVQSKVLEAMAMGVPVVCTGAAFGGLEARDGVELLVADTPDAFAAAVLRVILDPDLAGALGTAGRRYVELHHSWESGAGRLSQVYDRARSKDGRE